jgi:di/tricarboxylate transporter
MPLDAWTTVAVLLLVFGLLACTRIAPDLIFIGAVTLLIAFGILTPKEALAGVSNPGVITIGVLYVVAAGLQETGVMASLATRLLGRPKSVVAAQARMMLPVLGMSALVNNTPIVAMWLPVLDDWAKKRRISASKLMLPLSYAAILGGACTLIGTSTNLVVSGLLLEQAHIDKPLHLFEIAKVGIPCAIVGVTYILLVSRFILPDRKPVEGDFANPKEYTIEMLVETGSPLIGQTIEQAGLRQLRAMYLMEINREDDVLAAVSPQTKLQTNDRLVFVGIVESVVELQRIRGLTPATDQVFKLDAPRSRRMLIEAVVSNTCPLVGQTIRDGRFRTIYNAAIIAVSRNGVRIKKKIGDIILRSGDTLLLETHQSFLDQQRNSRDFFLVSKIEGFRAPRHERATRAAVIFLAMVALAGTGTLTLLTAGMLAAGGMIMLRCSSPLAARANVKWEVLLAIAASLGLAQAMIKTGIAEDVAAGMLQVAGTSPVVALAAIYLLTMLCTELMTNAGAAVIMFPIGLKAAESLDVSVLPFAIAIMLAASFGFATPLGYQTNLMVYGPGGYKLQDFLKMGIPLNLLMASIAVPLIPIFWPF